MTESYNLAESVLCDLDIAILRRTGEREYELFGRVPDFYRRLFADEDGTPSCAPWEKSEMLDFFLTDAELFFSRSKSGQISSGIWQEEQVQAGRKALVALAMCCDGEHLLVLRLLSDEFTDRARILQKAREHLLERRVLHNDIEVYKHKARFDSLTSLLNRATFTETLSAEMSRASASSADLSLLMLDIDNFKSINDIYGHLAGDTVLAGLGRLLSSFLRREDIAFRYGGEEFAILAPFTPQQQAFRMAEKLRKAVAEYHFGDLPQVTVSIGCATYRLAEDAGTFISRADLGLYDAKNSGKNKVCLR